MALYAAVKGASFFNEARRVIDRLEQQIGEPVYLCVHEGHLTLRRGVLTDWPGASSAAPLAVFNWSTEEWSVYVGNVEAGA